jgi:hypothetical protein
MGLDDKNAGLPAMKPECIETGPDRQAGRWINLSIGSITNSLYFPYVVFK